MASYSIGYINTKKHKTKNRKQKWEKKTTVRIFQVTKWRDYIREIIDMAFKGKNFKVETEYFLVAAQNNVIMTNYMKARFDNTQKNSKCWLCCDIVAKINHIVSESSKLAQKK